MKKFRKRFLMTLLLLLFAAVSFGIVAVSVNAHVKGSVRDSIVSSEATDEFKDSDCIIVLGCGVRPDGNPSNMLTDRLITGIDLYKREAAPKLLMSGDHSRKDYDEVNVMKQYAKDSDVPSEDIFMDHAGLSTYESLYRAKEIFKAQKIIIVSQEYHLYRALFIADKLGLEAVGVSADIRTYRGQTFRDIREVLARTKDYVTSILKPKPTFLGETIPVDGNGDVTNDK